MKKFEIESIDGHSAAFIIAIFTLFSSLIILLLDIILPVFLKDFSRLSFLNLLMPVVNSIVAYLLVRLFCFIYNKFSKSFGGIRVILRNRDKEIRWLGQN